MNFIKNMLQARMEASLLMQKKEGVSREIYCLRILITEVVSQLSISWVSGMNKLQLLLTIPNK